MGDSSKCSLNHCFVNGRQGIEKNLKIVDFFTASNGVGFRIMVEHDKNVTEIFQGIKNSTVWLKQGICDRFSE